MKAPKNSGTIAWHAHFEYCVKISEPVVFQVSLQASPHPTTKSPCFSSTFFFEFNFLFCSSLSSLFFSSVLVFVLFLRFFFASTFFSLVSLCFAHNFGLSQSEKFLILRVTSFVEPEHYIRNEAGTHGGIARGLPKQARLSLLVRRPFTICAILVHRPCMG